jgi:hypothetical protein
MQRPDRTSEGRDEFKAARVRQDGCEYADNAERFGASRAVSGIAMT